MKYIPSPEFANILLANGLKEVPKSKAIDIEHCQPGYHPEGYYKRLFKFRDSDRVSLIFNYSIIRIEYGKSYIEITISSEGQLIALIAFLKSNQDDQEEFIKAIKKGGLHTMIATAERVSKSNPAAYQRFTENYSSVIL